MSHKLISKHQLLVHMGAFILDPSKTVATEMEIQVKYMDYVPSLLAEFGSAFFSSKEGVPVLLSI